MRSLFPTWKRRFFLFKLEKTELYNCKSNKRNVTDKEEFFLVLGSRVLIVMMLSLFLDVVETMILLQEQGYRDPFQRKHFAQDGGQNKELYTN